MNLSESDPTPGSVYLIPNLLGETSLDTSLPAYVARVVGALQNFLVEDEKSARKLIKQLVPTAEIRSLNIQRLNEHTKPAELKALMAPLTAGEDIGIISEAGCPAIADPGADVVRRAHHLGAQVVPLVGPCSMVLALMASGLNGQRWRFVGYLPVEGPQRKHEITSLDRTVQSAHETQIMMDTPYRTQRLFVELLETCHPDTQLCVAQELTTSREYIRTASIAEWRQEQVELSKIPTLFLIGR
jgi:16S rRNA (cytidine1402-2'-O)-methyltransferase